MYRTITLLVLALSTVAAHAQDGIDSLLQQIERNNNTLEALRKETQAAKIANHTGLTLDDPEIELAHLWGSPAMVGNRKNIDVSQTLDMATLSGAKRRLARQQDAMADCQYLADRNDLLLKARLLCIDVIYLKAMLKNLADKRVNAQSIVDSQRQRMDSGEGNRIEYNNAITALSMVDAETTRQKTELDVALAQLQQLNGGHPLTVAMTDFPVVSIPADFDSWYAQAEQRSPMLAQARQAVEVAQRQMAVTRTEGMPKVSAGFSGEYIAGQKLNGVTLGLSIPLWGNKNRMRQARAETEAAKARQADARLQLYQYLRTLYDRQDGLRRVIKTYDDALDKTSNLLMLRQALNAGAMTIFDYRTGVNAYYDLENQRLDALHSWHLAVAEMIHASR